MNKLETVEKNNQRVLTTSQLAEVYGTDYKFISQNFARNKNRYVDGKHYFTLSGDDRRDFLNDYLQNEDSLKHAKVIYLWTAKGALLHAKSLGTNEAWNAYEQLVDDYFKKIEQLEKPEVTQLVPNSIEDLIILQARSVKELKAEVAELKAKQTHTDEAVEALATGIMAIPDSAVVVRNVNELVRWTRTDHGEIYDKAYDVLKNRHGIDIKRRIENERDRIQKQYNEKTGRYYAESTLKQKVNGIDIMVREGCLGEFNEIVVAQLSAEKARSQIKLIQN